MKQLSTKQKREKPFAGEAKGIFSKEVVYDDLMGKNSKEG